MWIRSLHCLSDQSIRKITGSYTTLVLVFPIKTNFPGSSRQIGAPCNFREKLAVVQPLFLEYWSQFHFHLDMLKVDYRLGDNPVKMSYMLGFGPKFPQQLHHRGASIPSIQADWAKIGCNAGYSYYNSPSPNPNVHNGAMVGGPDSSNRFSDQRSDYSHSEPSTYMNVAFVGSVAGLLDNNEGGKESMAS